MDVGFSSLDQLDSSRGIGLFTDGSAWTKDGSGGWAWVAIDVYDKQAFGIGGEGDTTNNRMEMMAWIMGLEEIFKAHGATTVIVCSDSEYVGLGATNRSRKRNLNRDLWERLDQIIDKHLYVEFTHVRGHRGHEWNELADKLAGEARQAWKHQAT